MASAALPPPASTDDALDMVLAGLRHLNAADPTWAQRAEEHPKIATAMATGILSESWARALCEITGMIPPGARDEADGLLLWAKLHGAALADLAGLATEMYLRSLSDGLPEPEDRSVRLATTLGGAGDTRSKPERYHDALAEAMKRLLAAGLLPDRAGQPVKALVHMTLAELCALDGGSALAREWITAAARWAARAAASVTGSDGGAWLDGRAARAVACDAMLVPVVTGDIDPAALEDLVRLCVELHRLDYRGPAPSEEPEPVAPEPAASGPHGSPAGPRCPAARPGTNSSRRSARPPSAKPSTCCRAPAGSRPTCGVGSSAPGWPAPASRSTSGSPSLHLYL